MYLHATLSRLFPYSFSSKLLAVAFAGLHVPLLLLLLWLLWMADLSPVQRWTAFAGVIGATVAGTAGTLAVLYRLLSPLREAADALDVYCAEQRLPLLPERGDDELGRLLRSINRSLRGIDAGLRDARRHALLDPLTDSLNRRGCERALADSVSTADEAGRPFTLFVIDMDNLKPINDRYGHAAGDQVLVRLVHSAYGWLGPRDWIGRWGGDEFLLGVHATEDAATQRFEQWQSRLERDPADQPPVHVSAGSAVHRQGEAAAALYRRADAAMYRAKFSGGRRLVRDGHADTDDRPLSA